jgi:predicted permease
MNSTISGSPKRALDQVAMRPLFEDFRSGLRVIRREPGFAAVAILTLGVGIACATTVFSWVDGILLHPFPGTGGSGELAVLEMVTPGAPNGGTNVGWLDFRDYRDGMRSFDGLAAFRQTAFTVGEGPGARLAWGELVSGNYFAVLGVRPVAGRFFDPRSDGPEPVAVISERLWRSEFGADPAIAGRGIRVNRQVLTVAGVAPAEFRGSSVVMLYDIWVPLGMGPALGATTAAFFEDRGARGSMFAIGRLREGVDVARAAAEAATLARRLETAYPATNRGVGATVLPASRAHNGVNDYLRTPLEILLAVALLVLLLVCANVANLLLARAVGRRREFGIRLAIGASRGRVAAQVLRETLVLAMAGTGTGLVMLLWTQGSLAALVPDIGLPVATGHDWNGRMLAFSAAACVTAALLAGASPALLVFRSNLQDVLKEGGRGGTGGVASGRTRVALVVGQIALATVALTGAAVFVAKFHEARSVDTGLRAERVVLGRFFLEAAGYSAPEAARFAERLRERLGRTAGVEAASYTDFVPLSTTAGPYANVEAEGYVAAAGEPAAVNRAVVSPGYFGVTGIPLVEGRDFDDRDGEQSARVAIVNQTFARRYFGGAATAVGRRIRTGGQWHTVVGVARDSKYFSPGEAPLAHFYLAFAQARRPVRELYFLVKMTGEGGYGLLRQAVADTDPHAAAFHAVSLAEYTEVATLGQKVAANLMGALGGLCLLLAAVGIYSVMSYTVSQRAEEIGIRIALGAGPAEVVKMIAGQGMGMGAAGIGIGLAAAGALGRMAGLGDAASFGLAAAVLAAATLAATAGPAWRAARMDPLRALRK